MDKYEAELEKAYREAIAIPQEYIRIMPLLRFVGTIQFESGSEHYYYCKNDSGKYYYDTDYARRARARKRYKYK